MSIPEDSASSSVDSVSNSGESVNDPTASVNTIKLNAILFAEENFGRCLKQFECEQLTDWTNWLIERGSVDPDVVIIDGLQRCIKQGVFKFSYLEGVMTDWIKHGLQP